MKSLTALGLTLLVCGCANVVSSNGGGGSGGTGGLGGGAGGAGGTSLVACGTTSVCVADPGAEWMGPVALIDSASGCGGAFPDEAAAPLFDGLQVDTASCPCSCAATAACSILMFAVGFSGTNCVGPQGQESIAELQCYDTFSGSHSVTLGSATTDCGPGTVAPNIPTPTWSRSVSACGGFAPGEGMCDPGQTCVPTPGAGFETGLCYVQDGDHTCPADFPNRTLFYSAFSDTRACSSTCSCDGSGASCRVSVTGYASSACVSPQGAKTVLSGGETCVATDTNLVRSIQPGNVTVDNNGTCSPGTASLSGAVTEDGATTVCCN